MANKNTEDTKKKRQELTKLIIRISTEMHEELRLYSFKYKVSMAEMCREGIETTLQKYRKKYNK